jgi:hypothetical protein
MQSCGEVGPTLFIHLVTDWRKEVFPLSDPAVSLRGRIKEMDSEHQKCPICGAEVDFQVRYPRYLCQDCRRRTTDAEGRPVDFFNYDLSGYGAVGQYLDRQEPYEERVCFVDGIRCTAEEARFGGIVIQAAPEGGAMPGE